MIDPNSSGLTEYQSIKKIHAGRILRVFEDGCIVEMADGNGARFLFEPAMTARYMPVEGDYWVVYDDGYQSISPKHAFEPGYVTLAPDETKAPAVKPWWEALDAEIVRLATDLCLHSREKPDAMCRSTSAYQVNTPSGPALITFGDPRPLWTFWVHAAERALEIVRQQEPKAQPK